MGQNCEVYGQKGLKVTSVKCIAHSSCTDSTELYALYIFMLAIVPKISPPCFHSYISYSEKSPIFPRSKFETLVSDRQILIYCYFTMIPLAQRFSTEIRLLFESLNESNSDSVLRELSQVYYELSFLYTLKDSFYPYMLAFFACDLLESKTLDV